MKDRELLGLAAKVAGAELSGFRRIGGDDEEPLYSMPVVVEGCGWTEYRPWNALEDDADAFQLALRMRMLVDFEEGEVNGMFALRGPGIDRSAAMRRAIVLAAVGAAQPTGDHE